MTPSISTALHSPSSIYVIRLKPGEKLKESLQEFAKEKELKAAIILTCVGSLTQFNLRFANQKEEATRRGHFEIMSLAGTLSEAYAHMHLCISDERGVTTGGHLLDNNIIYTTAEIAIAALTDLEFHRAFDSASGYRELQVRQLSAR